MTIQDYIQDKKNSVSSYLETYLKQTITPQISPVGRWGGDAVTRILHFTTRGKMLRSTFIFLMTDLFASEEYPEATIKASAAMELFQTGLLIHDDIMDQDESRRGIESMHIQYQKLLEKNGTKNSIKTGESFALCSADLAFFLAHTLLSSIKPDVLSTQLTTLLSQEMARVCISQMQDVFGGQTDYRYTKEEILSGYTYKTGRYTCALPCVIGATICKAPQHTINHLWKLGTSLGLLYQIKDDELNLFADQRETGKPIGSDIREGKQTLYRYFLMEKADEQTKKKLQTIFGNPAITHQDVEYVRHCITHLDIHTDIHAIVKKQEETIRDIIAVLPLEADKKARLEECVAYCICRTR